MKRTLLSTLVITSTLGLSANVFALGMGELELKSTLNQPLQAEIKLSNIDDLTEWEIKPSLASDGDFDRAGVEKVFFLSDIDFEIKGNRIVLTSDKSVTEPFLNFLVQVNWPSGRVLREYTLLLDPPVFDDAIQPLAAKQTSQRIETQTVATAPLKAAKNPNKWQSEAAAPGTYKVQKDDTLWEIAINTRPNRQVSPQQMMLAIQDSNPGAFINGNINRLKTHKVLRIPAQQQIAARNDSQAVNEVLRQNLELKTAGAQIDATASAGETNKAEQLNGGGELKLLSKPSQVAEFSGAGGDIESGEAGSGRQEGIQNDLAIALETLDTSTLENNDLKQRLASLEEQIATLQRLVSLKDDQLASIQTIDLQKEAQFETVPGSITENLADADSALATEINTLDDVAVEGNTEDFNYDEAAVEPEAEVDPALVAAHMQQQAEDRFKPKGFIAEMQANPALAGGLAGGILLLLGLIGLGIKKRRDAKEGDIEDPELSGFDENFEFSQDDLDESSLDDFEFDENDSAAAANELNDDLLEGIGPDEDDFEASIETTDTVAQTADVIGEAEIYIAYGRFDQAADLLKNSIEQEPSRIDLRIKLLEVYLETDDATLFSETELDLNSIGDLEANEKAVAMRSRLSSPIFREDETLVMDEGMLSDADIGLDMEALADSDNEFSDGIDFEAALDLTEGVDLSEIEESLDKLGENNVDLDVYDANTIGTEMVNLESDWDTDTELDNEFNPDNAESTATLDDLSEELSLDNIPVLDEDLGGMEGFDQIPILEYEEDLILTGDDPILEDSSLDDLLGADLNEDSVVDFDLSESLDVASAEENKPSVNGSFTDLASMGDNNPSTELSELTSLLDSDEEIEGLPNFDLNLDNTGFEVDSLGDLEALESELNDLTFTEKDSPVIEKTSMIEDYPVLDEVADFDASSEFDLNELDDLPDFTTEHDLDIVKDKVTPPSGQNIDLEQLAAADDEFDFLAGTDECATKLDLARAYLDMEDNKGAKELLQEVVTEGSDQQKHDARALMDSIG
ncbi:MAG: pilus assembly protein FimV [Oleispira sp.]|jgi:pilus assembly protein FimV